MHGGSLGAQVLSFVSEHIQAGEARLAGNSVHVDAAFLRRLMPRLHAHMHHRIVDVSTVAELCSRWYPADAKKMPRKKVSCYWNQDAIQPGFFEEVAEHLSCAVCEHLGDRF